MAGLPIRQGFYLHNGVNMSTSQQYTIYGPAGLTIDVYGTAEKALSKASQYYTINPPRVRHAVETLERDGLFGYSCGMDYIVAERVNP